MAQRVYIVVLKNNISFLKYPKHTSRRYSHYTERLLFKVLITTLDDDRHHYTKKFPSTNTKKRKQKMRGTRNVGES